MKTRDIPGFICSAINEIQAGVDQFNHKQGSLRAFCPEEVEFDLVISEEQDKLKFKVPLSHMIYRAPQKDKND